MSVPHPTVDVPPKVVTAKGINRPGVDIGYGFTRNQVDIRAVLHIRARLSVSVIEDGGVLAFVIPFAPLSVSASLAPERRKVGKDVMDIIIGQNL